YLFKSQNITPLIDHVISELTVLADNKNITLIHENAETKQIACFDKLRISQVLRNLTSNAIKFSPKNSKIRFRVKKTEAGLTVSIHDEGVGIPNDELDVIFESFSQSSLTQTNAGGTGLGLPICKEIIESGHGGWIKAENAEEGGAVFRFFIPAVHADDRPEDIKNASGQN
ncbi:MAG: ATP-binding protein, partial [Gammaproteobacteria bacterium]|nr:ATP-binding protein [Gammaproteobacteria bacterium]